DLQEFEFVGAYCRHKSVSLELACRLGLFRRRRAMSCLMSSVCLMSSSCLVVICFMRRMLAAARRLRFAFAMLAPPQRLRNQRVGQHQLGFHHVVDPQQVVGAV